MAKTKISLMDLFMRIKWASSGTIYDMSKTNYNWGWGYLGDDTPTVQDFNFVQQKNDEKDKWLFDQINELLKDQGITASDDEVTSLRDAIKGMIEPFKNDLKAPDGFKHIGRCKSIAELRTIRPTRHGQRILVDAYYEGGTTGGGEFIADLKDLVTPDDGGACLVVDGNGGRWKRLSDTLHTDDFGIESGVDMTLRIQAALDSAANSRRKLEFGFNTTYIISSITIPAYSSLETHGAIFRKGAAGSEVAVSIDSNVIIDRLMVLTQGKENDNGIRIKGSNVSISELICESESIDSNYGVHIQSKNNTPLMNVKINRCTVKNFKSAILGYNIIHSELNNILIECYVTGLYLRDTSNCRFNYADIHTTSPSATGGPGNNGLLIESTLYSGSTNNLQFNHWIVRDAGEHGYRIGGQLSVRNIWFDNCQAIKPGSANGNVATGACGFKVLGATKVAGQSHQNIFFDHCHVEDVNTNARGQGNFCGFLLSVVKNVQVSNSSVINKDYEHSCWHGISLESVEDVFLTNNNIDNCKQHAIRVVSATYPEYPGWYGVVKNVQVSGGTYSNKSMGSATVYFVKGGGNPGEINQFVMTGALIRGGIAAVRIESYYNPLDSFFDFEYAAPEKTDGAPPILGSPVLFNVRSKWFGSYSAPAKDGSVFIDTDSGVVRRRINGNWMVDNPVIIKRVNLGVIAKNNVSEIDHIRSRYVQIGELINVSGAVSVKPTTTGRLEFSIDLPVASNSDAWADCSGTWDSSDGVMHGSVTFDAQAKKLKFTGISTTSELRNCTYTASYWVV